MAKVEEEEENAIEFKHENIDKRTPQGIFEDMDKFKFAAHDKLQENDEIKTFIRDMSRAFCVMQYEENFDPEKNERTLEYKNYRVLVGTQENINTCKKVMRRALKSIFGDQRIY